MNNYYFTFGSDERFPYQNTYLVVKAPTKGDAVSAFRRKYPDRVDSQTINCSEIYTEAQWDASINPRFYRNGPAEIIEAEYVRETNDYLGEPEL